MDTTKLNISFNGTDRNAISAVLKSADVIIPYFERQETDASAPAYSTTMHAQSVISFVGMLQELVNKSGGSVNITNAQGESLKLEKTKGDFHFGELEKKLQPML